jgi:hypothetical protein
VPLKHGGNIRLGANLLDEMGAKISTVSSHNFAPNADWLVEFDVSHRIITNDHGRDATDLYETERP